MASDDKLESDCLQYFQRYIISYNKAGIRKYIYAYEKFLTFLLDQKVITTITPKQPDTKFSTANRPVSFNKFANSDICRQYKDYLFGPDSKLSGETPYDYFKRFRTIVNKAYKQNYILKNPCDGITLKKPISDLKKLILTEQELQTLAGTHCSSSEVKRAFLFTCFTGLGEAEIKQLKCQDVAHGRLISARAKNGNKVTNKLSKTAIKILGDHGNADDYVFNLASNTTTAKHLK